MNKGSLSSIGEFGLIRRITRGLPAAAGVVKGAGDDCAVLEFDRKNYMLFCSDMIVEDVDFTLADPPRLIGRKALAVNLSDIAACAGAPKYCLVSLALSRRCHLLFVDKLYQGIRDLARQFQVSIVGGDISKAAKLSIDISLIGFVEKKRLALRSGARAGDSIVVSGKLGNSLAGRHLRFTPQVAKARWLSARFGLHAMIDISDGLAADLGHILEASRVGARLLAGEIPCVKGLEQALYDGEDFELLCTLPPAEAARLLRADRSFRTIGRILPASAGLRLVGTDGIERELKPRGYSHF